MELSTLLALACAFRLSLATPIASSSLLPLAVRRSHSLCTNYPDTVAGTNLQPSSSSPKSLTPRHSTDTVLWCAERSSTYIILKPGNAILGYAVADILSDAYDALKRQIENRGDGNIPGGIFIRQSISGVTLATRNTNNHQQTFGVLAAAISALANYMATNTFGAVTFWIFDGANEVGRGSITSL